MKLKKIGYFSICLALIVCLTPTVNGKNFSIKAAGFSVYANKSTVAPGERFTVTVSISAPASGVFNVSGTNVSLSSSSCEVWGSTSCSVSATAGTSGTASVTVTAPGKGTSEVTLESNDELVSGSHTAYANIKSSGSGGSSSSGGGSSSGSSSSGTKTPSTGNTEKPKTEEKKSTDSSLKSLSVSQGTLSPAFKAGTTSYKLDLPGTVNSLKVSASANDSKASVSGTGEKKLNPGDNKLQVTCTAENGATTTYTINAHVDEKPLVYVKMGDKKLGVSRSSTKLTKKLFEETKIKIDGTEVQAWTNESLKMTLLYLENGDEKDFYFYDTEKKEATSVYRPMALLGENIAVIDVPQEQQKRNGMDFGTVKIDNQELPGWTFTEKGLENYALIYVMNDAGDKVYYQYEKTGNTLQKYAGTAAITQDAYDKLITSQEQEVNQLKLMIYALGAAVVALIIALIVVICKKRKPKKHNKIDMSDTSLSKSADIESESLIHMNNNEGENF